MYEKRTAAFFLINLMHGISNYVFAVLLLSKKNVGQFWLLYIYIYIPKKLKTFILLTAPILVQFCILPISQFPKVLKYWQGYVWRSPLKGGDVIHFSPAFYFIFSNMCMLTNIRRRRGGLPFISLKPEWNCVLRIADLCVYVVSSLEGGGDEPWPHYAHVKLWTRWYLAARSGASCGHPPD